MNIRDNLAHLRFRVNMKRINGLVNLIQSDIGTLKSPMLFGSSEGVRSDIFRAIVVFLHATFEDLFRNHLQNPNKNFPFYSKTDFDKAFKKSNIDPKPFTYLYPPLTQMAKRRKLIVHEADLINRSDTQVNPWNFVDEWQLIMWLIAVPAFAYQLRISRKTASINEINTYENLKKAIRTHTELGNQLLSLTNTPKNRQKEALTHLSETLKKLIEILDV
jgi:hypothetical protein